jgi:hypothetical protein
MVCVCVCVCVCVWHFSWELQERPLWEGDLWVKTLSKWRTFVNVPAPLSSFDQTSNRKKVAAMFPLSVCMCVTFQLGAPGKAWRFPCRKPSLIFRFLPLWSGCRFSGPLRAADEAKGGIDGEDRAWAYSLVSFLSTGRQPEKSGVSICTQAKPSKPCLEGNQLRLLPPGSLFSLVSIAFYSWAHAFHLDWYPLPSSWTCLAGILLHISSGLHHPQGL